MQFLQVMRAKFQVGARAGELDIGAQLANVAGTLIDQQRVQHLGFNGNVGANAAAFGREKSAHQLVPFHRRALVQAGESDGHGNAPPKGGQKRGRGFLSCCRQQQQRGRSFVYISQAAETLAVHEIE